MNITDGRVKKFTYFIGIDVSRNELDYAVMHGRKLLFHKEDINQPESITNFIAELKTLPNFIMTKAVFCMEQTGIYCNHLITVLKRNKANVVIDNPLQIRNSCGVIRDKYDKIDAIRIAQYAYINREHLKTFDARRAILLNLANLFSLRNRLLNVKMSLSLPLVEQSAFAKKGIARTVVKACKNSIKAIQDDVNELESTIDKLIASDQRLKHLFKIITSVPHVGRVTAIQFIISTNEFNSITDPKKFACYAGVAPFKHESGLFKGRARVSPIANKKVNGLLHVCALSCIQKNEEMITYYERKVKEGKPKMAVINAIKNKLILRVFACVNQDRCFEKNYINTNNLQQV